MGGSTLGKTMESQVEEDHCADLKKRPQCLESGFGVRPHFHCSVYIPETNRCPLQNASEMSALCQTHTQNSHFAAEPNQYSYLGVEVSKKLCDDYVLGFCITTYMAFFI